jgi:hypothetical protein
MSNWSSITTSNTSQGALTPFQPSYRPPVQSQVMGVPPYQPQPVMMGGYPPLSQPYQLQPVMMSVPVMYVPVPIINILSKFLFNL